MHYVGQVCAYSNLPACEGCPFKVDGVLELTPVEDVSLQSGTAAALGLPAPETNTVVNEDGSVTVVPQQSNMCPHNAEFFADPNWEAVINGQRMEMEQRAAEAAAAAAAAAAQQQQQAGQ